MAYIGQKGEVKEYVAKRARAKHEKSGFPAFWGPNYDWVPDQDHGSILMKALQSMLMQVDGRRIYLLPAWPREWDVEFQLHAPFRTIIVGKVKNGEFIHLEVNPKERLKDVVIIPQLKTLGHCRTTCSSGSRIR
jgi:alpha-L-fucosidase 2